MKTEMAIAEWVSGTEFADLPVPTVALMKTLTRTIVGTTVAGATADGCAEVVEQVREWGGPPEATIFVYGGKVAAQNAVIANSTMARALDICDGEYPGQHIGTTAVPVAFAIAELSGGCSGADFLAALAVGAEIASRFGFISHLDGFDPTGVCSIFSSTAVAARLLGLDATQTLDALALAFNRAGGSFQSNIDGSLAVRLIQGFVSQNAVTCAQLAARGITGPKNFVEGVWGYYHLFCKDQRNDELLVGGLGEHWLSDRMGFKTAPSCGATITGTDVSLQILAEHDVDVDDIDRIDVRVASTAVYNLVGHEFEVGKNPEVNGQFTLQYCVANVFLRKCPELRHFSPEFVCDPAVLDLARRINVRLDEDLAEGKPELAARTVIEVHTRQGDLHRASGDAPSGFPPITLTDREHEEHFWDNAKYGGKPLPTAQLESLVAGVARLETVDDVRALLPDLVCPE